MVSAEKNGEPEAFLVGGNMKRGVGRDWEG